MAAESESKQTDPAIIDRRYRSGLLFLFVELRLNRCLDLFVKRRVVLQRVLAGIASLRELRAFVAEPRATFLDNLFFEREIEQGAGRGNPLVIHDVELRFGE